jgi:hypothetical protein
MKTTGAHPLGVSLAGALVVLAVIILAVQDENTQDLSLARMLTAGVMSPHPAFVAYHPRKRDVANARRGVPCVTAYNSQANPNYGFGPRRCVGPTDVVSGDRIIGRDPDPFIRNQLLRAYNSGYPD